MVTWNPFDIGYRGWEGLLKGRYYPQPQVIPRNGANPINVPTPMLTRTPTPGNLYQGNVPSSQPLNASTAPNSELFYTNNATTQPDVTQGANTPAEDAPFDYNRWYTEQATNARLEDERRAASALELERVRQDFERQQNASDRLLTGQQIAVGEESNEISRERNRISEQISANELQAAQLDRDLRQNIANMDFESAARSRQLQRDLANQNSVLTAQGQLLDAAKWLGTTPLAQPGANKMGGLEALIAAITTPQLNGDNAQMFAGGGGGYAPNALTNAAQQGGVAVNDGGRASFQAPVTSRGIDQLADNGDAAGWSLSPTGEWTYNPAGATGVSPLTAGNRPARNPGWAEGQNADFDADYMARINGGTAADWRNFRAQVLRAPASTAEERAAVLALQDKMNDESKEIQNAWKAAGNGGYATMDFINEKFANSETAKQMAAPTQPSGATNGLPNLLAGNNPLSALQAYLLPILQSQGALESLRRPGAQTRYY